MKINCEKLQHLNGFYEEQIETNAIFLTGSKGLGKTSVIRDFLNEKRNVIHIACYGKSNFVLEPMLIAINMFYISKNEDSILDNSSGLNMTERINMELIKICSRNKTIFYFENVTNYEQELLIYISAINKLMKFNCPMKSTLFSYIG